MKVYKKVKGTMKVVPEIEVNVDTVYLRSSIKEVKEKDFNGWEYDEIQYNTREYAELTGEQLNSLGEKLAQEKLNNMKKNMIINNLGKEISKLKLDILKTKGGLL